MGNELLIMLIMLSSICIFDGFRIKAEEMYSQGKMFIKTVYANWVINIRVSVTITTKSRPQHILTIENEKN
ncbi:hypothetical protein M2475_000322 [Breznakia sp. PF5-3]|uniref:hypothetical protein n=1 Tax=unclassified Breznakia TaxID=2623764 RepID=UPI002404F235|nr:MULTISPECIES: hypothetical protein [unclassified Breznakia]MDF9823974.1 hypothetical protein [Breznakia sp. PM6-1]MDF9834773.1 hypothetical protein [Breznakia sp. PF5-3]MDF9838040.1 hypothetical protein [Breznakia sp. PFB2-8]MDF9860026.1 hypothetical protein [Breznakia sp. PH5-24]